MNDQQSELLCLGFGYTARALADLLREKGWRIAATTRSAEKASDLKSEGVTPFLWGEDVPDPSAFKSATAILVSAPPDEKGCPAFAACEEVIAANIDHLSWIGYLSSNGVYGDHGGGEVDETSPLLTKSARGKNRIKAESAWASFGAAYSVPTVIFRLPGIYGPGRSAIETVRAGEAKRIYKKGQVFNRMHVDDIAAALAASLSAPGAGDLFNLSDDEPSPPQDVVEYACRLLGVEPPPLTPIDEADLSEMGRSFYADNKRVSNKLMKEALGITLAYPTYREGLEAIARRNSQSTD